MTTAVPMQGPSPCGTCTLCCKVLSVDELSKPGGKWCDRCNVGEGCGQYEARPQSCRDFECVWLQSQYRRNGEAALPAALRPDRCKVVIDVRGDGKGLVLHVDPDRPTAADSGPVAALIASLLVQDQEVIVACGARRKFLSRRLRDEWVEGAA